MPIELSIIIPTFNEKDNVRPLLDKISQSLEGVAWEAIFVDDDSPDGTALIIKEIARQEPRVRCLQRIGRRGLSSACIEGMLSSAAPFLAVMDADLQHDANLLRQMLEVLKNENLDLVVGSRYVEGGRVGQWSSQRQKMSRLATNISRLVIKAELKDPMSGYFMLKAPFFNRVVHHLSGRGFKILMDIFASSTEVVRFKELPFEFGLRLWGESKLNQTVLFEHARLIVDKLISKYF